jgi:putative transposase
VLLKKSAQPSFTASTVWKITYHILTSLYPTVSLADFVKEVKTGSALWIKENSCVQSFSYWQEGYAAFTSSRRDIDDLIEYIKRQQEHHRKVTFGEEYGKLFLEAGVEFDARYVF